MKKFLMPGSGLSDVSRGVFHARPKAVQKFQALALLLALSLTGLADVTHTVLRGQNLGKIARKHGTTVKAIAAANGIGNPNLIRAGRKLRIPGKVGPSGGSPRRRAAGAPLAAGSSQHKVAKGENLSQIAKKYGTSLSVLTSLNRLANPSLIKAGQILSLPGRGSAVRVAAVAEAPRQVSPPPVDPKVPVPPQPLAIPDRPPVTRVTTPEPPGVEQLIEKYSRLYGVDPALMKGLAWQESGWKQHVVSSAGAIGIMQVMPETGVFISRHLLKEPVDLSDREQNVRAGVRFFAFYLAKAGGDEYMAVAGYFQGLRSVWQTGVSERTKRYVAAVMALRQRFKTA